MRILVVHQNFPGQFGHLVQAWSQRPGWDVRGLGRDTAPGLPGFKGLVRYKLHRQVHEAQHPYLRQMEAATLHGQAAVRAMLAMKKQGFIPDAIVAHPGWGETLYAKDVFPDTRLIHLCEWYYQAEGADLGFDPEFPLSFDGAARIRTWNALHSLNLAQCDVAVTPTEWQRSRHPAVFRERMVVQHEGIPTHLLGPDPHAQLVTPSGTVLKVGMPIITYVARNLEPYRGFHNFMRALELIQRKHPTCHTVVVGGDEVSYGERPKDAPNWREKMLREVKLDATRTHFMGRLPYAQYVKALQISSTHVYLSYPFVLSWSMLEAMACGALVIGADTAPVREIIEDSRNGYLADFFSPQSLAQRVMSILQESNEPICEQARQDVQRYSHAQGLRSYDSLLFSSEGS